jgi:hypothetical protein
MDSYATARQAKELGGQRAGHEYLSVIETCRVPSHIEKQK